MLSELSGSFKFILAAAILTALVAFLSPSSAPVSAAPRDTLQVFPGVHALRKAIRAAQPGDILNIHAGTYQETITINKTNLILKSSGDGVVVVDGHCNAQSTIRIRAEGATIRGLTIRGGGFYSITLEHIASGNIRNNTLLSTCDGAEYGVNVFDGGSIKVISNTASGFEDAGVYIGGINATPNGVLMVHDNTAFGNTRGIIIEDSANVSIKVLANHTHDNSTTGILIHNSDGIRVINNTVTDNSNEGIHLDTPSDNNIVNNNTLSGHTFDILNEGIGNCFANNTYSTSSGPINPC